MRSKVVINNMSRNEIYASLRTLSEADAFEYR